MLGGMRHPRFLRWNHAVKVFGELVFALFSLRKEGYKGVGGGEGCLKVILAATPSGKKKPRWLELSCRLVLSCRLEG